MDHKHTLTELNNCSREELITMVLSMQGQLDMLNQNIEKLIEQVRLANSYRFGKHTETLKSTDGQLSFFDEAKPHMMHQFQNLLQMSISSSCPPSGVRRKKKTGSGSERFPCRDPSAVSCFQRRTGCLLWRWQLASDSATGVRFQTVYKISLRTDPADHVIMLTDHPRRRTGRCLAKG